MNLTGSVALIAIGAGFLTAVVRGIIRAIRKGRRAQRNFDERVAARTREHRERMEAVKQILEDKGRR